MSKTPFVTEREVKVEELPWGPHEWLCRPDIVDADKLLMVRVLMPAGKGHAFHRHPEMEEIIYVLEGTAEQWVDRKRQILQKGEMAHIPTDVVHGTYNVGPGTLAFLAILSPAKTNGPALIDMSQEAPWRFLRST
jgi:quercetin dioxygenase-like cupin family protein